MRIPLSIGVLALVLAIVPSVWAQEKKDPTKEFFWYQCYICHVFNDPYDGCPVKKTGSIQPSSPPRRAVPEVILVQNAHGPDLCGVFGSPAARRAKDGYQHSASFLEAAPQIVWTEENLDKWLLDTREFIPGTWMFVKLPDPAMRKAVIEFLKTYK